MIKLFVLWLHLELESVLELKLKTGNCIIKNYNKIDGYDIG